MFSLVANPIAAPSFSVKTVSIDVAALFGYLMKGGRNICAAALTR
jgi:hypothetical protein